MTNIREGSNVFLKLIFTIHNKSHFLYYLRGTIFLRFKKNWNETESLIVSQLVPQLCWKVTFLTQTSSKFLKIFVCPVNLPTMRLHEGHFPRNFPSFFVTVTQQANYKRFDGSLFFSKLDDYSADVYKSSIIYITLLFLLLFC